MNLLVPATELLAASAASASGWKTCWDCGSPVVKWTKCRYYQVASVNSNSSYIHTYFRYGRMAMCYMVKVTQNCDRDLSVTMSSITPRQVVTGEKQLQSNVSPSLCYCNTSDSF